MSFTDNVLEVVCATDATKDLISAFLDNQVAERADIMVGEDAMALT